MTNTTKTPFVAILMGSDSDLETMQSAIAVLKQFDIPTEVNVLSAHRTPRATHDYVATAESRGCAVFIAAAGLAAHLAGSVAAITTRPVIGVPMEAGALQGLDALLSTVQMPGGVPVACMAIGKPGAKNAGYFAAQLLALQNEALATQLKQDREEQAQKILAKNVTLSSAVGR